MVSACQGTARAGRHPNLIYSVVRHILCVQVTEHRLVAYAIGSSSVHTVHCS